MKNRNPTQKNIITKFTIKFILLSGVLYGIIAWMPDLDTFFKPVNRYDAAMSGFLLSLLGLKPLVDGVFLSTNSFSVQIVMGCSATYIVILFFAFVMAFPASRRHKAIGLLFGIPILLAGNIVRIALVFIVGTIRPSLFEYAHVYVGEIVMILFVLSVCMVWIRSVVMVKTTDAPLSFFIRFIALSSIPFVVWLYLNNGYFLMTMSVVHFLLNFLGYHLSPGHTLLPNEVQGSTFDLIAFSALVLATKSIGRRKKIKGLIIGLALLLVLNIIFRLCEALHVLLHVQPAGSIWIGLKAIREYILPFVFWLAIVHKEIFKRKGIFTCPICGEEKVGIIHHIKAKHGEDALKDKRVRALLEELEPEPEKDEDHMRVYGYIPRMQYKKVT